MKRLLAICALALWPTLIHAVEARKIGTFGGMTCGRWSELSRTLTPKEVDEFNMIVLAWSSGFVSAKVGRATAETTSLEFFGGWLLSFCNAHPTSTVMAGAVQFIRDNELANGQ